MPIPISLSWSGGKDSAFALHHLRQNPEFEVVRLHTTFGEATRRVGMHGIKEELIQAQAKELGLPLDCLFYPASGDNQAYEKAIHHYLDQLEEVGIQHIGFGDIFLEDLRKYREDQLAKRGFQAVFPLWKKPTVQLASDFLDAGFKTIICAANAELIPESCVGKDFDRDFLRQIAGKSDPCGENGEFHSFCYAGPIFKSPLAVQVERVLEKTYDIPLETGEVQKKSYWFAEIELA